jgi:hypothetical protein
MTKLVWDQTGERRYETGVDQGVLYIPTSGVYGPGSGYAWNGLTTVTESPSGAEATPLYADNIKYLNLQSAEEFGGTIEAYTFPDAFLQCDGSLTASPGVNLGQQSRRKFGLCYRTRVGDDVYGSDAGYKLHLIYGAQAAPSEKAYATINDTPEAITFSWEITTTPVPVTTQVSGVTPKPTALMTIDSTKVPSSNLTALENALYGTAGADARLPLPDEVISMFAGTMTLATPTQPTYTSPTITIPTVTGVVYKRGDTNATVPAGPVTVGSVPGDKLVIYAVPAAGYNFAANTDDDWQYTRT